MRACRTAAATRSAASTTWTRRKLGQTDNFVRQADDYGGHTRYNDSVDITVNARLRNGLNLQGGTSTGRLLSDQCGIRDDVPEFVSGANVGPVAPYCRQNTGFLTTYKTLAAYTVPKIDVLLSGHVLEPSGRQPVGQPGGAERADCAVAGTAAVGRRERHRQPAGAEHDVRRSDQPGGHARGQAGALRRVARDVLARRPQPFNTDAILAYNPTFNATWPTPTTVITARLARVSVQFDW